VPKVNGPEIGKGFWTATGVLLALFVLSMVTMLLQRAKSKS